MLNDLFYGLSAIATTIAFSGNKACFQ